MSILGDGRIAHPLRPRRWAPIGLENAMECASAWGGRERKKHELVDPSDLWSEDGLLSCRHCSVADGELQFWGLSARSSQAALDGRENVTDAGRGARFGSSQRHRVHNRRCKANALVHRPELRRGWLHGSSLIIALGHTH